MPSKLDETLAIARDFLVEAHATMADGETDLSAEEALCLAMLPTLLEPVAKAAIIVNPQAIAAAIEGHRARMNPHDFMRQTTERMKTERRKREDDAAKVARNIPTGAGG